VDVTNTGAHQGDEVAQLYVHPRVSSVSQPVMQLKGFERITLKPGEKKTIEFKITPDMLSILNIDMHRMVEPGGFDLMIGPSSDNTSTVKLTVAGAQGETAGPAPAFGSAGSTVPPNN
jgi:beta-glucosidase